MSEHWRVGSSVGRTLYIGDRLVGLMDTAELAKQVVMAVNAAPTVYAEDLSIEFYDPPGALAHENYGRGVRVTHIETDTVWELMELLQAHVAAWRLPSDESADQGLASQRLFAATARMLARVSDASIAEWQTAREGDSCRTYLADLDRQDGAPRAAGDDKDAPAVPPSAALRTPEHDLVSAFWALSQALRAEGKHPEVIAKDAVADLEATRAAGT